MTTTAAELTHAVRVLRDEVLETPVHGDRDPRGVEVFEALLRALSIGEAESRGVGTPTALPAGRGSSPVGSTGGETIPGLDLALHDSVARRLAWGDGEETVLADAELVFDRLLVSVERAFRDPTDQARVIEAATQVAATVARVVALAAVARASRERAARTREEMAQRQLREVLDKQTAAIAHLEHELKQDFR